MKNTVRRRDGTNPLKPASTLLCKLGSIAVHADELMSDQGHPVDRIALIALLEDAEVVAWVKAMGVYLPVKR